MAKRSSGGKSSKSLSPILAIVGVILGVAAILSMLAPGVVFSMNTTLLGQSITAVSTFGLFALAFGGKGTSVSSMNSSSSTSEFDIEMSAFTLSTFIVLAVAIVFLLAYIVLGAGKKKSLLATILALVAFLAFIVAGVMFFLTKQMNPQLYTADLGEYGKTDVSNYFSLGYGAILSGIASILAGLALGGSLAVSKR